MSNVDKAAKVIDQWTQEGYELNSTTSTRQTPETKSHNAKSPHHKNTNPNHQTPHTAGSFLIGAHRDQRV